MELTFHDAYVEYSFAGFHKAWVMGQSIQVFCLKIYHFEFLKALFHNFTWLFSNTLSQNKFYPEAHLYPVKHLQESLFLKIVNSFYIH